VKKIKWALEPEEQDYEGAKSYLGLIATPIVVEALLKKYSTAPVIEVKAKDVIRAAGLIPLSADNFHVARDLRKVADKTALSPILLVRGVGAEGVRLTIADGYHRACAVYLLNEDANIRARIVEW
jgi:hypothetical protein